MKHFILSLLFISSIYSNPTSNHNISIEGTGQIFYFDKIFSFFNLDEEPVEKFNTVELNIDEEFDDFSELDEEEEPDLFYSYNLFMTDVNDFFYIEIFYPASRFYKKEINEEVRISINNFFFNLKTPIRLTNKLLQGKLSEAFDETISFVVNTTVGVGGLLKPSESYLDITLKEEDFGQTLGYYGIGSGPHIVLPILGPSNLRDIVGLSFDTEFDPIRNIEYTNNFYKDKIIQTSLITFGKVNEVSLQTMEYEDLKEGSFNLYIFLKEAYEENRKQQIKE